MKEQHFQVTEPCTLLALLQRHFADSSANELRKWIAAGRLAINGQTARRADSPLKAGQKVTLRPRRTPQDRALAPYGRLVYEDQYIIVIDKKCGVLSVADDKGRGDSLHGAIKRRCHPHKIYVVHRLDRETSGLILFAKEASAFRSLKEQLAQRTMGRRYLAVVAGVPQPPSGSWIAYLYEDKNLVMHACEDPQRGERAVTHYRTVATDGRHALLELTLETGKKNQIRVHCRRAGHPVVGDDKYGGAAAARLALHATALSFNHPHSGQPMSFDSPLPPALGRLVQGG